MDLDLLHIKLTAYALGELDMAQKADIERILTESQDARDQVARAKAVAKAIKDLLPQTAEDIQPMTPAEYCERRGGAAPQPTGLPAAAAATGPSAGAAAPASGGHGLVWLLAVGCALLAIGWLWQWKTSAPAPKQQMIPVSELETKEVLRKNLADDLQKAKDALEKELASRAELEARNASLQKDKDSLTDAAAGLESKGRELENRVGALEYRLARAQSAVEAFHQPFVRTQAQLVAVLPASADNGTLRRIQDALQDGEWPLPALVDPGELAQSLTYAYPAPSPGQKLPLLAASAAVCPWNETHVLARVTLTAGTEGADLASLQVEFNPAKVASWRVIGREARTDDGSAAGGQGCGELKPGTSLTLLCELAPAADPVAALGAKRAELLQKIEDAKHTITTAKNQAALAEAKLQAESLRLDLQDLDVQIAKAKGAQAPGWRYRAPGQPTPAAALGDWFTATAAVRDASGQGAALEAVLRGQARPFPEADADFRLAAAAAALGMTLRGSPDRGQANLDLVSALLKDLPSGNAGAQLVGQLVTQAKATQALMEDAAGRN